METPLLVMPIMMSLILKSVNFTEAQESRYLENKIFIFSSNLKRWILLGHASTCTTQLFPQIWTKKFKFVHFDWIWHKLSFRGGDFESEIRFLIFQSQNPFLGQFVSKRSKLFVLPENWHTWYLKDANSYFNLSFLNFQS